MKTVECPKSGRLLQLRRFRPFSALSEATLELLADRAVLIEFAAQDVLIEEGGKPESFLALLRGQVKVVHRTGDGRERLIHVVSQGATVGEASMFREECWPATAVALEDGLAMRLDRRNVVEAVRRDGDFALCMLGTLAVRHRMFVKKLSNQGIPAAKRVARYVLHRALMEKRTAFVLQVSREEMATMLGITRETLSRVLSRLAADGVLTVQGREVSVLDMEALGLLAEMDSRF